MWRGSIHTIRWHRTCSLFRYHWGKHCKSTLARDKRDEMMYQDHATSSGSYVEHRIHYASGEIIAKTVEKYTRTNIQYTRENRIVREKEITNVIAVHKCTAPTTKLVRPKFTSCLNFSSLIGQYLNNRHITTGVKQ